MLAFLICPVPKTHPSCGLEDDLVEAVVGCVAAADRPAELEFAPSRPQFAIQGTAGKLIEPPVRGHDRIAVAAPQQGRYGLDLGLLLTRLGVDDRGPGHLLGGQATGHAAVPKTAGAIQLFRYKPARHVMLAWVVMIGQLQKFASRHQ